MHTHTYPQLIPYSCINQYQSNHLGTIGTYSIRVFSQFQVLSHPPLAMFNQLCIYPPLPR